MDTLHIVWLALVQGLTEFLPVSSSAHLILVPRLLGWPDQGLAFDVAVHLGTLIAVVAYFRTDLAALFPAFVGSFGQLVPAGVVLAGRAAGLGRDRGHDPGGARRARRFKGVIETSLRSPLVIATTTVVFGLLLWWADRRARLARDEHSLGWGDFVVRGLRAGAGADSRHVALGHHDHGRAAAGADALGGGPATRSCCRSRSSCCRGSA